MAVLTVLGTLLGTAVLALTDEAGGDSKDRMVGRAVSQVRSIVDDAGPKMVRFNSKAFLVQEDKGEFKDNYRER